MSTNYTAQYQAPVCPSGWNREERAFYNRLIETLDEVFIKFGRLSETDLSTALRTTISEKADSTDLENYSTHEQTATSITDAVGEIAVGGTNLLEGTYEALEGASDGVVGTYNLAVGSSTLADKEAVLSFDWALSSSGTVTISAYRGSATDTLIQATEVTGTSGHVSIPITFPETMSTFTLITFTVASLASTLTISSAQLEIGNTETAWGQADGELIAGTSVKITKDKMSVSTPTFEVGYEGNEYLSLDSGGGYMPQFASPQVPIRYDGPEQLYVNSATATDGVTYFSTLGDALAVLNEKWIDTDVTVTVSTGYTEYEQQTINGISGGGSLTIGAANTVVYEQILIYNCSVPIYVSYLKGLYNGIVCDISACSYVALDHCVFESTASAAVINITLGATARVTNTTMAVGNFAARVWYASRAQFYDCTGDQNLCSHGGFVIGGGTLPSASPSSVTTTSYQNGYISVSGTVSQGSGAGTITSASSTQSTFYPSETAWYQDVWSGDTNSGYVIQGYTGYGQITGCMWFDLSSLSGMTAVGAKIRLTRISGYGQTGAVNIRLLGLGPACTTRGDTLDRTTVYGIIGTLLPGETKTFTINPAAVNAILGGSAAGMCLFVTDASKISGLNYSTNYARMYGTSGTASTKPLLTVTV